MFSLERVVNQQITKVAGIQSVMNHPEYLSSGVTGRTDEPSSKRRRLYFLEDIDVIVVFEVRGQTLTLYDVIGRELPTLEEMCYRIPHRFKKIEDGYFEFPITANF